MPHDPAILAAVALAFVAAGFVKGALGLGLPTIGMGLLGLMLPPATAASLLILPSLLTNAWQALTGGETRSLIRRLWPMLAASAASTLAFSPLLATVSPRTSGLWLGIALLAYGLSGLMNWRLAVPARAEPGFGIGAGLATGMVTGATGVFVLPAVPYLAGTGLERDRLVQAMGLSFTVSTLALGLGLWLQGAIAPGATAAAALAILPALAGMWLGAALRARISAATFRRLFFLLLVALGAHGILRGVG
jgi:uncharacterized protein